MKTQDQISEVVNDIVHEGTYSHAAQPLRQSAEWSGAARQPEAAGWPTAGGRSDWRVVGAYALIVVALLFASFDRGIAGLKPSEIALVCFATALIARRIFLRDGTFGLTAIDAGFALFILTGTILPLAALDVRGIALTSDNLRALLGPIEYYLWYRCLLEALPIPRHLPGLTRLLLIVLTGISAIGDLQILHAPGVLHLLTKYFPTYETLQSVSVHRATSLVGGWEVLAALAAYTLILIHQLQSDQAAKYLFGRRANLWLSVMLAINAFALLATFSAAGYIAVAAGYVFAWFLHKRSGGAAPLHTPIARRLTLPRLRTTLLTLGIGVLATVATMPALLQRLQLQYGAGHAHTLIPQTWLQRFSHWQIVTSVVFINPQTALFGVRPAFTYPVSVFGSTESLYLLVIYRGGIIYLCAFLVFVVLVMRATWLARQRATGFQRTFLTAAWIIVLINFVLGLFDAHFFDAGESQFLLTIIAASTGAAPVWHRAVLSHPASLGQSVASPGQRAAKPSQYPTGIFGELPVRSRWIARGALSIGMLATLVLAGVSYRLNKQMAPGPVPLAIGLPYDPTGAIWQENQQLGTAQWQLSPGANSTLLEGYAGAVSALPGDTIPLYLSAQNAMFVDIQVYRMGWYNGQGGHLFANIPQVAVSAQGTYHATTNTLVDCASCQIDPLTHSVDAHWRPTYNLRIGANWPTGVYLIKLSGGASGLSALLGQPDQSFIPLIVRQPIDPIAHPQQRVLVVVPVMTYVAENIWGGANLSTNVPADRFAQVTQPDRATQVSFNRPYTDSAGAGELLNFDLHTVRWLERGGYDLSYTTDLDLAEHPEYLAGNAAVVFTGSSSYWTAGLYDGLANAANTGVSLLFLSAANGIWQARLGPDAAGNPDRLVICYKVRSTPPAGGFSADPTQALARDPLYARQPQFVTAQWRDPVLHRPENGLLGAMAGGSLAPTMLANAVFARVPQRDWVANPQGPLGVIETTNTFLQPGEQIQGAFIGLGYDSVYANSATPAGLTVMGSVAIPQHAVPDAAISDQMAEAATVFYRTRTGGYVFDAGSMTWSWALDEMTFPGADLPNAQLGLQSISVMTGNFLVTILPPSAAR